MAGDEPRMQLTLFSQKYSIKEAVKITKYERTTFSHKQSVFYNAKTGGRVCFLNIN